MAKAKTQVGTPYYIAPEILKGRAYTNKADIWSMGVLFYEICALDVPIKAASLHDLYKKIMNFRRLPALPSKYSKTVTELCNAMMNLDASKRPSIKELLDHPALSKRVSKFMNEEEKKEEFDHTVLHKEHILKKQPSTGSEKAPLARPYSARSNRSGREELKSAASNRPSAAKQYQRVGSARGAQPKPVASRMAGRGSADKFGQKKPLGRNDQNRPPVQTPKFGMGARKNSEGALHAMKRGQGLMANGSKASPRKNQNYSFADKYGRPNPSQTPRNNGAVKKLNAPAPVGFQKQRPGSAAAYGQKAKTPYQRAAGYAGGLGRRPF
jgi:serine/threonine protein kinase